MLALLVVVPVAAGLFPGATVSEADTIVEVISSPGTTEESATNIGMTAEEGPGIEVVPENDSVPGTTEEASENFSEASAEVIPVLLSEGDLPKKEETVQNIVLELDADAAAHGDEEPETPAEANDDNEAEMSAETNDGKKSETPAGVSDGKEPETPAEDDHPEFDMNEGLQEDSEEEQETISGGDSETESAAEEAITFYPNGVDFGEAGAADSGTQAEASATETSSSEAGTAATESEGVPSDEEESFEEPNAQGSEEVQYLYAPATVRLFQKEIIPKPEDIRLTEKSPRVLSTHRVYITHNRSCRLLKEGQEYEIVRENSEGGYAYSYRIFASNFAEEGSYAVTVCSRDRNGRITTNAIGKENSGAAGTGGTDRPAGISRSYLRGSITETEAAAETASVAETDGAAETASIAADSSAAGAVGADTFSGSVTAAEALTAGASGRSVSGASAAGTLQGSFSPGFIVDGTAPACSIAGLRSKNTVTSAKKMNVTILPQDNVAVEEVRIRLNEEDEKTYSGEALEAALTGGNGGIRVPVRPAKAAQKISVKVTDSAGNESGECTWNFTLQAADSSGLRTAVAASASMAAVSTLVFAVIVHRKKKIAIAKTEQM